MTRRPNLATLAFGTLGLLVALWITFSVVSTIASVTIGLVRLTIKLAPVIALVAAIVWFRRRGKSA